MSRKLFKAVLGAIILCSMVFSSMAIACLGMNNMAMSERTISDHTPSCDMMNMTPADPAQDQDRECCNFTALMSCETNDLLNQILTGKIGMDGITPPITTASIQAHPLPESIQPRRLFFPSYILKSQILYLQTSRLRI